MYPRNAASPERIAIGPVVQISDGAVQTSGVAVKVIPFGGTEASGTGTIAYSADGVVLYTPVQSETNYTSFVLVASKAGCIPASTTVVTTAANVSGNVTLATSQPNYAPLTTLGTNAPSGWLNAAAFGAGSLNGKGDWATVGAAMTLTTGERSAAGTAFWNLLTTSTWTPDSFGELILVSDGTNGRQVKVTGANHVAADVHECQPDGLTNSTDVTTILARLGAWTGTGINTILGAFRAIAAKASALTPTDLSTGTTFNNTTDSLEAIRDRGDAAWVTGSGGGGSGTVNVLPASGVVADRAATTTLKPVVGETVSQSITVYQSDGTTAYDLSGKTLAVIFETLNGGDVAVVEAADISIGGTDDNVVTFAYPATVTASVRTLSFAIRDAAAPKTMYLQGVCSVVNAPSVDA